jgi:hypothetical protein
LSNILSLYNVDIHTIMTTLPIQSIISGEKLQQVCDVFLGSATELRPPLLRTGQKHKVIDITMTGYPLKFDTMVHSILRQQNYSCRTVFGHLTYFKQAKTLENIMYVLRLLRQPFRLVLHNCDGNFEHGQLSLFEQLPLLKEVYTQNLAFDPRSTKYAERVHALPIGIANSHYPHGNLLIWGRMMQLKPQWPAKTKQLYLFFDVKTNVAKRLACQQALRQQGFPAESSVPYQMYLSTLVQYQFAACPEGNGLDTHRFWEALYLHVIPVCLRTPMTEQFSRLFPVCLVQKWSEVTPEFLQTWYSELHKKPANEIWQNYDKLDCRYWLRQLTAPVATS